MNGCHSNEGNFEDLLGLGESSSVPDKNNAPLKSLKPSSLRMLSTLLNPIKIIPNENGLLRDWRGLAELAGITAEKMMFLESKEDPTCELIKFWATEENNSIRDLTAFLALIDRYDVCDDVSPLLENDITFYWSQDEKIRNKNSSISLGTNALVSASDSELTLADTYYDAFILYADEDSDFAMQIVDKMENEYNLKICVKDRDIPAGTMFVHEKIGRIIEEQCHRLLAIFSPNFLKSQGNQFLVSYAQALALELRQRKIIPCMYIRCDLPPSVRYSFCLDYNRSGKLWNFWDKLSQSIRTSPTSNILPTPSKPIPAKHSSSIVSSSLPAHSAQSPPTKESSYDWWDAEKPRQHSSSDSGVQGSDVLEDSDVVSLQSSSPILSSSVEQKSSRTKWFKKIIGSSKKKKKEMAQSLPS